MLARNAESLYWIGRYVERADDTARILDVTVHQLLEDSSVDPDQASRTLLRVLGIEPPKDQLDVWSLTDLVAFSRDTAGGCSIVESISAARENARGAREVTSTEIWECLNTTYNALAERERAAKRLGPHEFLSFVEGRAAMFAGLADSTLSRDDGYRFMVLGRAIERVDMTVRLLLSRVGDSASSPAWVTLLRSAGAHDTYLRTYRGVLDAGRVVEFMLLDRLFPRSIFYSLRLAEHSLDELLNRPHNRLGATAEAQRLLGRARSELEFLQPGCAAGIAREAAGGSAEDLPRGRRGVGAAVLPLRARGWRGLMPGTTVRWSIEEGEVWMWRLRVVHSTGYAYKSPVTASFNEARLTPRSDTRQNVILNRVETVPATRSYRYVDYWGTAVTAFDLHAPHTELEVTSSSVVETDRGEMPKDEGQLGRSALRGGDRPVRRGARRDALHAAEQADPAGGGAHRQVPRSAGGRHRRGQLGAQRAGIRAGHHGCALVGARCAPRREGRLPGLRASDADPVAQHGNSGALCVGLSASQAQGGGRRHHRRAEPRLDAGVDRRLVELRPHQRHRDQRAVHQRRVSVATTRMSHR